MAEIRTHQTQDQNQRNKPETAGYLLPQEEEADEIEVKVKDLNMQFKAWRDEK